MTTSTDDASEPIAGRPIAALVARHFRIGWAALWLFVTLGVGLELLHAFKLGFYLDAGHETRRLMWTLAHAHGVGLSLVHLGYGATLHALFKSGRRALDLASTLLSWATLLLPLGFFLGGVATYEGDPGVGVLLVPVGALLLWIAVALIAREVVRQTNPH
jgi:hypothetical protein